MKKLLLILSVHSFVLLINGCGVKPPDVPLCVELDINRAHCVYTVSSKELDVDNTNKFNNKTWFEQRNDMIRMPVESWTEIKRFIIKICKQSNQCNQSVSDWQRSINGIDAGLLKKSGGK